MPIFRAVILAGVYDIKNLKLKIWRGDEYNRRGEKQLAEYLDYYHLEKGYLLSFNFNRKKETGVKEIQVGGKVIVEAVV